MAKNLIPEDLQALITQYLTDGVLTAKEREVILKKAEAMGLDRDEIDLYLDAEMQKIDQATDAAVRKQKGRQCPFCGANIPVLTDKCPECGGSITPEADKELEEILENLEEALVDLKSFKDFEKSKATVERYSRKAELYYSSNPKIQKLLTEVREEIVLAGKNARKKTFVNLAKKYKWILFILVLAIIGLIWYAKPNPVNNPQDCIDAVFSAIKKGDLDNAERICLRYKDGVDSCSEDIVVAYEAVAKAYVENGEYDRAIDFLHRGKGTWNIIKSLRKELAYKFVDEDEYDKAVYYSRHAFHSYEIEYKCIDKMKANGKQHLIDPFIRRTFSESIAYIKEYKYDDPEKDRYNHYRNFIAKFYNYAGLDYPDDL